MSRSGVVRVPDSSSSEWQGVPSGSWFRLADPSSAPPRPQSFRRVVGVFLAASLLLGVAFMVISAVISARAARQEALADARHTTDLLAELVVQPNLSDGLLAEEPAALAALDRVVPSRVVGRDGVVRAKLWTPDGRIVYSDLAALIGRQFRLGARSSQRASQVRLASPFP